jgi:hypothetical protein
VQPFLAEDARPVGPCERRSDKITDFDFANIGAYGLDNADELVSHPAAGLAGFHLFVRPEIAAADGGAGDDHERISGFNQTGIGDGLDPDVTGTIDDSFTRPLLRPCIVRR